MVDDGRAECASDGSDSLAREEVPIRESVEVLRLLEPGAECHPIPGGHVNRAGQPGKNPAAHRTAACVNAFEDDLLAVGPRPGVIEHGAADDELVLAVDQGGNAVRPAW